MSSTVAHPAGRKALDTTWVRQQFPSLQTQVNGQPAAFLDGPAGTQVPQQVMGAIQKYLLHDNDNTCGAFATSRRNDAMLAGTRQAMFFFFSCAPPEVSFGYHMTTISI